LVDSEETDNNEGKEGRGNKDTTTEGRGEERGEEKREEMGKMGSGETENEAGCSDDEMKWDNLLALTSKAEKGSYAIAVFIMCDGFM
jgi:hypothetical protein